MCLHGETFRYQSRWWLDFPMAVSAIPSFKLDSTLLQGSSLVSPLILFADLMAFPGILCPQNHSRIWCVSWMPSGADSVGKLQDDQFYISWQVYPTKAMLALSRKF